MIKYTRQQIEELDKFYKHPRNLVDLFEDTVTKWGERNAIGTKNPQTKQYEWITYKRLAERINNVRSGIHQLGIHKGDAVGVIIGNSVEWYVLENASHGLGAIFVPMYEKELLEEGGKEKPGSILQASLDRPGGIDLHFRNDRGAERGASFSRQPVRLLTVRLSHLSQPQREIRFSGDPSLGAQLWLERGTAQLHVVRRSHRVDGIGRHAGRRSSQGQAQVSHRRSKGFQ
jgi:hypothetical protein